MYIHYSKKRSIIYRILYIPVYIIKLIFKLIKKIFVDISVGVYKNAIAFIVGIISIFILFNVFGR